MRIEGLTRKAFCRNGLLLRIDPFAILILGTDQNRTRRTHRRDAIDRVGRLFDPPPTARNDDRILNNVAGFQSDLVALLVFSFTIGADALEQEDSTTFGIAKPYGREVAPFPVFKLAVFHAGA